MKTLQMMLKKYLIHQIMNAIPLNAIAYCLLEKAGLVKDELGGKIMTEYFVLRAKTYSYLRDDDREAKKDKGTKKFLIERILKHPDYKNCLLNNKVILKSQQGLKSEAHSVYNEEVNKIALSRNDDKKLQTFDKITTYHYGASAGKACKTEILSKVNIK